MIPLGAGNLLLAGLLASSLLAVAPGGALGQTCSPNSIGVAPSYGDTVIVTWDGRGYGQVFVAQDTLIQSISTWRPADPPIDSVPRYLFITETFESDCCGTAPREGAVLLNAGPLVSKDGDGVHPVEYRWVFDPPFALPHRGKFFLDVMGACGWTISTLASTTSPYTDGLAWYTSPIINCYYPGSGRISYPHDDMVFQVQFCTTATDVAELPVPGVSLGPNRPNPFTGSTVIRFGLPQAARVSLRVYNVAGRVVRSLVESSRSEAGPHDISWDGRDQSGRPLAAGVYLYRLTVDDRAGPVGRAVLLR
ncbi:MAG: T9SS type A sorting domain-containing protein [Candidatus Eisenbacteria bacterium]|uniref:T9SS type A sorting domain-containing protein n=1 Tax=Eiseniibacteriota bacterium TaxID=2212470 RepID=A0A538U9M4_UNCEI|nr:MAG: T9SS type A sorting domain-containing protein [Candidatus Eisenbacteria bacterium]